MSEQVRARVREKERRGTKSFNSIVNQKKLIIIIMMLFQYVWQPHLDLGHTHDDYHHQHSRLHTFNDPVNNNNKEKIPSTTSSTLPVHLDTPTLIINNTQQQSLNNTKPTFSSRPTESFYLSSSSINTSKTHPHTTTTTKRQRSPSNKLSRGVSTPIAIPQRDGLMTPLRSAQALRKTLLRLEDANTSYHMQQRAVCDPRRLTMPSSIVTVRHGDDGDERRGKRKDDVDYYCGGDAVRNDPMMVMTNKMMMIMNDISVVEEEEDDDDGDEQQQQQQHITCTCTTATCTNDTCTTTTTTTTDTCCTMPSSTSLPSSNEHNTSTSSATSVESSTSKQTTPTSSSASSGNSITLTIDYQPSSSSNNNKPPAYNVSHWSRMHKRYAMCVPPINQLTVNVTIAVLVAVVLWLACVHWYAPSSPVVLPTSSASSTML